MKAARKTAGRSHNSRRLTERTFTVCRRDDPGVTATFNFRDNNWRLLDILKPHEDDWAANVWFSSVEEWLRHDVKLYVAHLWLEAQATALAVQRAMSAVRTLGRLLPGFTGRPIDLTIQHAKECVRRYSALGWTAASNKSLRYQVNCFISFIRHQYPEVENNFRLVFPRAAVAGAAPEPLEQAQGKRVPTPILSKIIDACTQDLNAYRTCKENYIDPTESPEKLHEYQRRYYREHLKRQQDGTVGNLGYVPRIVNLHGRAIKAQALILALCTGRRVSAICSTRFDVKAERVEWAGESGDTDKAVLIRFREMKLRNVDEDVACPDAFGELALRAIETARELTAELRATNPQWKDYLFLVPTRKRKGAKVLPAAQLNDYLSYPRTNSGIIERYNIPAPGITIHNFRATRATNAWIGGLQVHEVAYDLGHVNADMTLKHYIIGRDEDRRRLQEYMDKGALSGALEDLVAGCELVQMRLGKRHVEIMRKQGRILSPNRYGYCALPSASGPCTRTTPCYVGPEERSGGCDHHMLSPDALPALEEDRELLLANVSAYGDDPAYRVWVQHQQIQASVVERKIREAKTLKHRFENVCPQDGSCHCTGSGLGDKN